MPEYDDEFDENYSMDEDLLSAEGEKENENEDMD